MSGYIHQVGRKERRQWLRVALAAFVVGLVPLVAGCGGSEKLPAAPTTTNPTQGQVGHLEPKSTFAPSGGGAGSLKPTGPLGTK
jgi:hypothetical protein